METKNTLLTLLFTFTILIVSVTIYLQNHSKVLGLEFEKEISVVSEPVLEKQLDFEIPKYKWLLAENWIKPTENNPVLYPTEPWEGNAVLEPTVLYEDGVYKMWYCGGSPCALGYATSTDGVNWTKYENNPIFGLGSGGESGTVRQNNIIKIDGIYYLYYVDDSRDMHIAKSKDGINFTKLENPVLLHDDETWERSHANSFQWVEDGEWKMLYEAQDSDPYALWKIGLANGKDQYTWEKYSRNPLFSIQTGKGMFGGPWVKKINGVYYLFHHASEPADNLPTDIYLHYSKDLYNWHPINDAPLVKRTQPRWEVDQVADPYLIEVNGKTFMYYDGDDNTAETGYRAWIGYTYFDGLLEDPAE